MMDNLAPGAWFCSAPAIADRLVRASDEAERESLKEELARLTFGDSSGHRGNTRENGPTRNALEPKRSPRVRNGVPLLPRRPKGSRRPTMALVNKPAEFPPAPATYAKAVANYERGAQELLGALEEMPESRLSETVTFFTGPRQMSRSLSAISCG